MRTDSNTILSLSSDTPPKAKKSFKETRDRDASFEKDFNKAKEVLEPKPTASKSAFSEKNEEYDESSVSSDSISASEEGGSLAKDEKNHTSEAMEKNENATSDIDESTSLDNGGKVLQSKGDELPSGTSALSLEKELTVESTLDTDINQDDAIIADPQNSLVNVSGLGSDNLDGIATELNSDDLDESVTGTINIDKANSLSSDQKMDIDLKPEVFNSDDGLVISSSDGMEKVIEKADEPLYDGNELSWVLSQMDNAKAVSTSDDVTTAITKGGVTSFNLLNSANNNVRLEPNILSSDAKTMAPAGDIAADMTESFLLDDAVLIEEPLQLHKKEQEAMINRISAQVDGRAIEDNIGGLNSSLQNSNVGRTAMALGGGINSQPANMTMNVPPNHPNWASEMSQKVAWVARDGGHTAHIRLDPPELGSLTVKVSVDTDSNTQVSFVAATPQARDLLESQMSRLRDMLAQQGMDLSRADVDVSQRDASGAQKDSEQAGGSGRSGLVSQDEIDEDLLLNNVSYVSATGVDYYA